MARRKNSINSALINSFSRSPQQNAGHAIANMFNNLGDVQEYKEKKSEEKKENEYKNTIKSINLQNIKDEAEDKKNFMNFVKTGQSLDEYNKEFITPKYHELAKGFSNKNKTLIDNDDITYNLAQANKMFSKNGSFNNNAFYTHMDNKLKSDDISERAYASVIDGVNKARKTGIYSPSFENTSISYSPTNERKNYIYEMESKYGKDKTNYKPYHEWVQEYRQSKKLTGEATYNKIVDSVVQKYSSKLGTNDFSNFDFSEAVEKGTMTKNERNHLKRTLASTREAKVFEKEFAKINKEYAILEGQAERFAKYANSKNVNTHVIQNATDIVRSIIPNFKPTQNQLENFEFRSDFLNFSAIVTKIQSGLTVTDRERERLDKSIGTLFKNKSINFVGVKQQLLDKRNSLNGMKDIAPEYFNVKYGHRLKNLDDSISIINDFLSSQGEEEEVQIIKDKTNSEKASWRDYE